MLQRGMTHPHVMGASWHRGPQPLEEFSLGALEWEKPPAAAFWQQKALGGAAMCPGGGSGQPIPLHCPLQQPPTPWGLGWKLSTAKCRLLVSYLEFCLDRG